MVTPEAMKALQDRLREQAEESLRLRGGKSIRQLVREANTREDTSQ
ncbi:hypothetical protein LCGC14_1612840 [marine sediment metagenome]|uniref:Uncharacterized protein n=1 Tax=marine sediment metagenome TaxID=412755 RepID=A0A0F9I822_9ZZZZ